MQIVKNENPEIATLEELIDPFKYDMLIDAVKIMCGFNNESGDVKVTSISARLRPSLLSCVDLLYTQIILDKSLTTAVNDHKKNKLDEFKLILETNWQWKILSNADKARKQNIMTKETVLPFDEDIEIIIKKIHELEEKYAEGLRPEKRDVNILNYEKYEVTIPYIIMLDRKRSGNVAEAELHYYVNRKSADIPLNILKLLTPE